MRQSRWLVLAAVLGSLNLWVGCPKPQGPGDAGEEDASEGVDAGPQDSGFRCQTDEQCQLHVSTDTVCETETETCVPRCRIDDDCAVYNRGLRCQDATGRCIEARGCSATFNCPPPNIDPSDYCSTLSGVGCRCVYENNDTGEPGVCRRRRGVCDECTDDSQCGNEPSFTPQGVCRALQGDSTGKKYCFFRENICPCGMVTSSEGGYCVPQAGFSCQNVGCQEDHHCPTGSLCTAAGSGGSCGVCEPRCSWNFGTQSLNAPGCPPGKTCWVDHANLDPASSYFGAGRCRPACGSDEECTGSSNPFGGPKLACRAENTANGPSEKRCRPDGECMDSFECPPPEEGSVYLGYCARATFECKTDCRPGIDPVSGTAYADCIGGYKCAAEGGSNLCKQQSCNDLGGARLACVVGQLCCGEDRNRDGTADPCPTAGVEPNGCFDAPVPPYCITCDKQEDCASLDNWNGSPLPSLCMQGGPRPDGSEGVNICAPSTHNDLTKNADGVPLAAQGCPKGYTALRLKVPCEAHADCQKGHPGVGTCDFDQSETLPDGGHPLRCLCTGTGTTNATAQCPQDPGSGQSSVCGYALQGLSSVCLSSVVCYPSGTLIYKPTSERGCGL
jgi:hypothetical protein